MSDESWEDDTSWDDELDGAGTDLAVAEPTSVVVSVDITPPLTMDEARELTEKIRSAADVLYVLIHRAHVGRAWEALGYGTFEAYVKEEFNISRSRAYQFLDQAKVIAAIEAAAPEGTDLHITEAAARDLKSVIGEVVPEIEERTRGLAPDDAADMVEEIVEDYRERKAEERAARDAEREADAAERAERAAVLAEAGFEPGGGGYTPPPAPSYDDEDEIDAALIRRNVQAAYDLYSSLSALKSMPDVQAVIDTIPVERRVQINDSLRPALEWLGTFGEQWFGQPWQNGGPEAGGDYDDEYEYDEDPDADFDDEDFDDEPED